MKTTRIGRVVLALGHPGGQPLSPADLPRYDVRALVHDGICSKRQCRSGSTGQRLAGGTRPTVASSSTPSEWWKPSRLTRLWWFDRHAFVNIAHADEKLYGAKFNGFVAGVFDLFPADVAPPPVNLNAGLILTDERRAACGGTGNGR